MQIILKDLPKISLNEWYSGTHWAKRSRIKGTYKLIVKSQFKYVFPKDKEYKVEYQFNFISRPLDATNTVAMVKMIEDIIFEDDKWDIVKQITISSKKNRHEFVKIIVA